MLIRDSDVYNAHVHGCFDGEAFAVCHLNSYHAAKPNGLLNGIAHRLATPLQLPLACLISGAVPGKGTEDTLSYSPHSVDRRHSGRAKEEEALFPFITQHKKLSPDIYHEAIMECSERLRITPEQARVAYECLKWEHVDREDDEEWKLYRLDVKRRLYAVLNMENLQNYDEGGIYARLTQEFNAVTNRYAQILRKRDDWIERRALWEETHQYPEWIEHRLKGFEPMNRTPSKRPKSKRRRKRV